MQEYLNELGGTARITILAQGDVFTLAKASVFRFSGVRGEKPILTSCKPTNMPVREQDWQEFSAEGMARRSHLDPQDINRGQEIAAGRALKALAKKLKGNGKAIIRHRFMG